MGSELELTPDERGIVEGALEAVKFALDLPAYRTDAEDGLRRLGRIRSVGKAFRDNWAALTIDERYSVIVEVAQLISNRRQLVRLQAFTDDPSLLEDLIPVIADAVADLDMGSSVRRGAPVKIPGSEELVRALAAIWDARGNPRIVGLLEYMGAERPPTPFLAFVAHHLRTWHEQIRYVAENSRNREGRPLTERQLLKHTKGLIERLRLNSAPDRPI